jgi:hypothetical protein
MTLHSTHLDKCNVMDILIVWIIILVDDILNCLVPLTVALQIDVPSIRRPKINYLTVDMESLFSTKVAKKLKKITFSCSGQR